MRDLVRELGVDVKTHSLDEIRVAYIRDLRDKAAGRGGEDAQSLTQARTKQALADARIKDLTYYRELKLLVPVDEIEPLLANWAATARSETTFAVEKLVAAIQSQHRIQIDQQLIDDTVYAAFRSIGSYPARLGEDAEAGGHRVGAGAVEADAPVAG